MFLLQIKAIDTTIWRATKALDTSVFAEAILVADRLTMACRRAATSSRSTTRTWVVEIIGETGGTFYRAPVACS